MQHRVPARREIHPVQRLLCRAALAFGLLALPLAGGASGAASEPATVRIEGSSTVYPLMREAARRFERRSPDADLEVRFSGTTAGFRRFCTGEIDIGNASRLMNAEEEAACKAAGITHRRLLVAMDAIVIVAHPDNTWARDLTTGELKRLWEPAAQGRAITWKDLRADWPDQPVRLFGRGQDSGTYDVFTTRIVGATRASRTDYVASEDEEALASRIAGETHALGFFGIGAYHRHWDTLKLLALDSGSGPVYPTLQTVAAQHYQPLSRPLFLYVSERSLADKPVVRAFLRDALQDLPRWIHFTGFMPLPEARYREQIELLGPQP